MKRIVIVGWLVSMGACGAAAWAQSEPAASAPAAVEPAAAASAASPAASSSAFDDENVRLLIEIKALLQRREPAQAVVLADRIIAGYDERFRGESRQVYGGRTLTEVTYYMLLAASTKQGAVAIQPFWGNALELKGYALVELGRLGEAEVVLKRAIALSPMNNGYLVELGQLYLRERRWPEAMKTFETAQSAVEMSPPETKNSDLAAAWRGLAYVGSETGRLDEAEALYRKCLVLNPADATAQHELRYIEQVRARQKTS